MTIIHQQSMPDRERLGETAAGSLEEECHPLTREDSGISGVCTSTVFRLTHLDLPIKADSSQVSDSFGKA
jgi:hypothetical protein